MTGHVSAARLAGRAATVGSVFPRFPQNVDVTITLLDVPILARR